MEIDVFRVRLSRANQADYDSTSAVWNGAITPRLSARCVGTAVCDDGIVIDLSATRVVLVNSADCSAWVQPGAQGDVDHETQAHGLATTGGIVSRAGVAGLSLGGGIGWLMHKNGLAVDSLLVVDGARLRASKHEHPDLFWTSSPRNCTGAQW